MGSEGKILLYRCTKKAINRTTYMLIYIHILYTYYMLRYRRWQHVKLVILSSPITKRERMVLELSIQKKKIWPRPWLDRLSHILLTCRQHRDESATAGRRRDWRGGHPRAADSRGAARRRTCGTASGGRGGRRVQAALRLHVSPVKKVPTEEPESGG